METIEVFRTKLHQLCEQERARSRVLSHLIEERNSLLANDSEEVYSYEEPVALPHYSYILPLIKDIHVLELKVKEKQKEYERLQLEQEAARLGELILLDCLGEEECVLKWLSQELSRMSTNVSGNPNKPDQAQVSNVSHHAVIDQQVLTETLGFTVLCQGVHVRVQIKSEKACPNVHMMLCPSSVRIGVKSDTFIPGLQEQFEAVINQKVQISNVVTLVAKYIEEEMAPFAIIIPMKKKGKSKSGKLKTKLAENISKIDPL